MGKYRGQRDWGENRRDRLNKREKSKRKQTYNYLPHSTQ